MSCHVISCHLIFLLIIIIHRHHLEVWSLVCQLWVNKLITQITAYRNIIHNNQYILMLLVALQFLTPWFYFIPKAALAAVICCAVIFTVDLEIIYPMWKSKSMFMTQNSSHYSSCNKSFLFRNGHSSMVCYFCNQFTGRFAIRCIGWIFNQCHFSFVLGCQTWNSS